MKWQPEDSNALQDESDNEQADVDRPHIGTALSVHTQQCADSYPIDN